MATAIPPLMRVAEVVVQEAPMVPEVPVLRLTELIQELTAAVVVLVMAAKMAASMVLDWAAMAQEGPVAAGLMQRQVLQIPAEEALGKTERGQAAPVVLVMALLLVQDGEQAWAPAAAAEAATVPVAVVRVVLMAVEEAVAKQTAVPEGRVLWW